MRTFTVTLLTATMLAVAAPAAMADPVIGIGEQSPAMFSDPAFGQLGIRHARLVAGWDALNFRWQRNEIDAWMSEAQRTGTAVLLSLTRSREDSRRRVLPSPQRYRHEFRRFRKRYPFVKSFIPWNEANHCSQPTCRRPDLAAAYFDVMKSECAHCIVLAADVLDQAGMVGWLRKFKRHVKHHATTWGLHNYVDANRFRTSGTRAMLRTVHGNIWFTETGGLVKRKRATNIKFTESSRHAAKATKQVFRLARLSSRIKRVYFYHWTPSTHPLASWDSALRDKRGRPRPAFRVLRSWIRQRDARLAQRSASAAAR